MTLETERPVVYFALVFGAGFVLGPISLHRLHDLARNPARPLGPSVAN